MGRLRLSCALILAWQGLFAQQPDAAHGPLEKAYTALRAGAYEEAAAHFEAAIRAAPARAAIRKDLAYTYLKIGENEAARDQFAEAMRLDPSDSHAALEYAFLCYETGRRAVARRVFDQVRKTGDAASRATAAQAFENVDRPLAEGIARWSQAVALHPEEFTSHLELARLAEQRDELDLAARHYQKAWQLRPQDRSLLVDLGRVWRSQGKLDQANAALLAASRGAEPHAAERARELLPSRYPFVYEFRLALQVDPKNIELRRELAYLLLEMKSRSEAEEEFRIITRMAPDDLLSAAQLGFLRLNRRDAAGAMPLLKRVLEGPDEELADRVRRTLGLPQTLRRPEAPRRHVAVEARVLGERSFQAGYLKDALKYLQIAHDTDPADFAVMLRLGWTYNVLGQNERAIRWFDLARKGPDAATAAEAGKAYTNLRPALARLRTITWLFPFYSSRWRDLFSYGQVKTEMNLGRLPFRPYFSVRFIGDTRRSTGEALPQYLSESSLILGFGIAGRTWHGLTLWGEAGTALSYLGSRPDVGRMIPDYRGGLAYGKGFGRLLGAETPGAFFETNEDAVYLSRFDHDFLIYSQNRFGYTPPVAGGLVSQLYWNLNAAVDVRRQYWANFVEFGPGYRFRWEGMPPSLVFSVNLLRGAYTLNRGNPRQPNYFDVRAGFWYAHAR